jgi:nucleotide-binding universal stress UspA family protein
MFEKIVVPLDGSKLAEVALPYAVELAGKMGSEIILLSVLPSVDTQEYQKHQVYAAKITEVTKRHAEKYLEKSAEGYPEKPLRREVSVGTVTRVGDPAAGILDYVGERSMKLIVMATHGRSGISRWAVGSVADKVVRSTMRQPLMLIRAKGSHPDIRAKRILKKALVPLDGSARSETVISYITEMARSLHMEVTLLRVIPKTNHSYAETEVYLQGWCSRLADKGITAQYEVRVGAAADAVVDLASELAIDVVTMSTRGQNALNLWPLGSVAQKVLLGGDTPLMLIRA